MIEHFCRFASETAAKGNAALQKYLATQEDGTKVWRGDIVCPFRVITGSTAGPPDQDGNPTTVDTYDSAFYLRISLPERDNALAALTQVIVTDSVERAVDKATTVLTRKGFTAAQIAALRITPELMGVKNPNE